MLTALPPTFFRKNKPPNGHVAGNLPCIGCGYNLRTLAKDARCPECGKAVQDTVAIGIYHGVDTWDNIRTATVVSAVSLAVGLALSAILVMVWTPSTTGFFPQLLIGMACVVALCAITYTLLSITMVAAISTIGSVAQNHLKTIAIALAISGLAIYWRSFPTALGFIALLGLIVGLPAWGCTHIVRLENWVGSAATRLATVTCWLARIAFWSAFVMLFMPIAYRSEIFAAGAVVVNTLYVIVLATFARRLSGIIRIVKCAEKETT